MDLTSKQKAYTVFLTGFFFVNLVGIMLVLAALSFAVKVPLSAIHFPVAIVLGLGINYYASAKHYFVKNTGAFVKSLLFIALVFAISFVLANYFYDVSIDGQTYHQATVIQLKNDWNPFYQELPKTADFNLWLNHYGKGTEIPEAVIYACTNKIETGKATNILLFFGAFFLTVSLLYRLNRFSTFKVYLISLLATLNPVVIVQMFSYYIDGQLALMLQCLLVLSAYLLLEPDKFKLYLFAIIVAIAINIKFTAIPYVGVIVIGLLALLWYRRDIQQFKRVFVTAAISSVLAIALIGFNPYVTNTIGHGNPFYPLAGKGKIDIMRINSPIGFPEKNRFENFFTSVFSRTDNMFYPQKDVPKLKVPFTFKMAEMRFSYEEDARIGGFGVLFSGVILLSLILLMVAYKHLKNPARITLVFALVTLLASIFVLEYSWWARYVPQLWLIPVLILAFSEIPVNSAVKIFRNITYVVIVLNICLLGAVSIFKNLVATQKTRYQLAQLKTLKETIAVDFTVFTPSRLKFTENHIPFKEQHLDSTANFVMKYIHAKVNVKTMPEKLPEPYLFKLDEKLKSKSH